MTPGTVIKLKKSYLKYLKNNSDEIYGYPDGIKSCKIVPKHPELNSIDDTAQEALLAYFMDRYSYERGLDVWGVITGDNNLEGEAFAYIVWLENELGQNIVHVGPENLERSYNGE